jgi:nondiscriminating glutamyl-tRNA synthetase
MVVSLTAQWFSNRKESLLPSVRVRIAPSPTGYLHVGTARAALYNWIYARQKKGIFLLRIEDTDFVRSSEDMSAKVLESLRWLGLEWDEGPYFQSERLKLYSEYVDRLKKTGATYYCYCTPEELATRKKAAMKEGRAWKYDRKCLHLSDDEKARLDSAGAPKAVRFRVPPGRTSFEDEVHGSVEKDNSDIEDFVVVRSDGVATYNFAVVVDDHDMAVTHVIRGDDHLSNTFKQVLLYDAMGLPKPQFCHLPLILAEDRSKLSKRHGSVSVLEFRDAGYLPEALVNFLALLGWSPGSGQEMLTREDLIREFSLDRVIKSGAVFDRTKLEWMNGQYINQMSGEELLEAVLPFLKQGAALEDAVLRERREWVKSVLILLKERARTLNDFVSLGEYFFRDDFQYDEKAVRKHLSDPEVGQRLKALKDAFSEARTFTQSETESILRRMADESGIKAAKLIHPLRVAVTGRQVGPGLFEVLELLGKEKVIERLDRGVSFLDNVSP